jgi:hypothetical protein
MWSCSRRGFPSTRHCCRAWWALTPPFHPYPCMGRSSFLWHCPWGRPLSRFGTALPCGARTFLPPLPESDHLTRSDYKRTYIALFARASASLFFARGRYCTSTLLIFAISSLAPACSGFSPSFFTLVRPLIGLTSSLGSPKSLTLDAPNWTVKTKS